MKDLTKVVHHPAVSEDGFASLVVSVQRASTIVFDSAEAYAQRRDRWPDGYSYGLHGTPTSKVLEAQLSGLEGAAGTILAPSGQAAISLLLTSLLVPGGEVLIPDNVYSPVRDFCEHYLVPRAIGYRVYDPMVGTGIADWLSDATQLVWVETPGSTTMEVPDLPAIIAAAKARGIPVGCDHTWATPLLLKPLSLGCDFAVSALSKYAGGHSDLLMGAISVANSERYHAVREVFRLYGIGVSPDDCSLVLRGLETMGVRLAHIGNVSTDFARRLESHRAVARILHPALPACPGHNHWRRDFAGASGVFSIMLDPALDARIDAAISELKIFALGSSWGATRSIIAPIAVGKDRLLDRRAGIARVLRISIGLEDVEDLWEDLSALLDRIAG
ncbi:PLP-dependent transferase [Sphingomonadaceae bacterium OTU29THOMA1]|nr:PLP-dependent transferase [Sphingomonadaceae bacterium OTU29THOMA1]